MTSDNTTLGHAPGLPVLTRRRLLAASPALLAPAALAIPAPAAPAPAPADTSIQRLYREWEALNAGFNDAPNEDVSNALFARLLAVEDAIAAEPVTCVADLAAKVLVHLDVRDGETIHAAKVAAECEALVAAEVA